MTKPTALLKHWEVVAAPGKGMCLSGFIYDDQAGRFHNGAKIISSRIVRFDAMSGKVETRNTVYDTPPYLNKHFALGFGGEVV